MPTREPTSTADLRARYGPNYRWIVLGTVMVGLVASIVSSTIVNVAVPDMSRHFAVGQERAQWIATAFMLSTTLALPLTPSLLERFGLRPVFIGGVAMLAVGGVVGGLSHRFDLMIAARVLEGFSAGLLQPIPNIVILRAFAANEQGRAMGLFGMGVVLAPALGPTVGGMLVEAFGWRSIFFFVVPPCVLAFACARRFLPTTSAFARAEGRFDWVGMATLSSAILLLLNGMVSIHQGVIEASALVAPGALLLAVFAWLQWRRPHPFVDVRLFGRRMFALGAIVGFAHGFGVFGSTYLLPLFLQVALGYSPSAAGAALLPGGIVLALTLYATGRAIDRMPPARLVLVGMVVFSLSLALMSTVTVATPYALIVGWIVFGRIGLGMIMPSLTLSVMRGVDRDDIPQAASITSLLRQFGGAVGVAAVGLLLEWRLRAGGFTVESLGSALTTPPGALAKPFEETFWLLVLVTLPAVAAAWAMRPRVSGATADDAERDR
jgi:EmrB/QacA subfamily drug resistance transporter